MIAMDQQGICVSSGSACRSGSPEPSHALLAMGLSKEEAHCSVRFSLGIHNTREEIDLTLQSLKKIRGESMSVLRFVPCR